MDIAQETWRAWWRSRTAGERLSLSHLAGISLPDDGTGAVTIPTYLATWQPQDADPVATDNRNQ